jgi:putative hemolysin
MVVAGELLFILLLILANGFFAAAEIAVITARRSRLEQLSAAGDRRARIAAELAKDPNRFLATVQVGITLVSTLAAVFGGAHLVAYLADVLRQVPWAFMVNHAQAVAFTLVVLTISYLTLVVGELVPKRMALANAERLARLVSVPMSVLSRIARPFVWLMSASTQAILRLLGQSKSAAPAVSLEEIEHLLLAGRKEGVIDPAEQMVATKALRLGDRTVKEIMRSRIEIDALDVDTPPDEIIGAVAMAGFSRVPVHEGDLDHIIGFVYTKDLLRQQHLGWPIEIRKLVRPGLLVPQNMHLDKLLEMFRQRHTQMAIVLDEFGGTKGLVTMEDVLEELVGEIHDEHRQDREQDIVQRDAASWLVDGRVAIETFLEKARLDDLRPAVPPDCSTMAGLVLSVLKRIPRIGERLAWQGLLVEVVDLDGHRVDRVLVTLTPDVGRG